MILSTLPEKGNFYRGNLHAHTVASDGHNTAQELKSFYKSKGYSFLAVTDHNVYTDLSETSDKDFLLIPGAEICTFGGEYHHVLALGNPKANKFHNGKVFAADWRYGASLKDTCDLIEQNGNLAVYAHPASSGTDISRLIELDNIAGVEIFNAMHEASEKNGHSEIYFDQLTELGKNTMCYATDNIHNTDLPFFGSVTVKADDLSFDSIFEALKNGAFYSSYSKKAENTVQIFSFYVNEKREAIVDCSKCRSIFIMTSKGSHLYEGPLHAPITFAVHPLEDGCDFVRAICTDHDGNISWTQPIKL